MLNINPSGYTLLEYVEATGSQYIQLNIGFNNTDDVKYKFSIDKTELNDKYMIASQTWNNNNNRFGMGCYPNGKWCVGYGGNSTGLTYLTPEGYNDGMPHKWTYTGSNKTFKIDGGSYSLDCSSISWGGITANLRLFYGYNAPTKGRIYYYQQKRNGTLIANMYPAKRNLDNAIGLYDYVTKTFFTSTGGPLLSSDTKYQPEFATYNNTDLYDIKYNNVLVWEKNTVTNIPIEKSVRVSHTGTMNYAEFTSVSSGTSAKSGTQYYQWDATSFTFQPVTTTEGQTLDTSYYTKNSSFVEANLIGACVISFVDIPTPEKITISKVRYGNEYYKYEATTSNKIILPSNTFKTEELQIINVGSVSKTNFLDVQSVAMTLTSTSLNGLKTLKVINSVFGFDGIEVTDGDWYGKAPVGKNYDYGLDVTFEHCEYIPLNFGGFYDTGSAGYHYTGIKKFKSVAFVNSPLKYIGANAFKSGRSTSGNGDLFEKLDIKLPRTLQYLGSGNYSICSSYVANDIVKYNNEDNKQWYELKSFTTREIPYGTIGMASTSSSTVDTENAVITFPSTLQYASQYFVYSNKIKTLKFNSNINVDWFYTSTITNLISIVSGSTLDFGTNCNYFNKNLFYGMQTYSNLYFRASGNITIGENAFYYKSARAVNIYTDNQIIKDYDWSTNQNITATFYHLDGTAWS